MNVFVCFGCNSRRCVISTDCDSAPFSGGDRCPRIANFGTTWAPKDRCVKWSSSYSHRQHVKTTCTRCGHTCILLTRPEHDGYPVHYTCCPFPSVSDRAQWIEAVPNTKAALDNEGLEQYAGFFTFEGGRA